MEIKNQTGLENFKPKINLNHNICLYIKGRIYSTHPFICYIFFCTAVTIESEEDIREFVKAKIESLVANVVADQDVVAETETNRFKSATTRFHRIFNIPVEEKLVNCKFSFLYFTCTMYVIAYLKRWMFVKKKEMLQN